MKIIGLVDNYISKEEATAAKYIISEYGDKTGRQRELLKHRELLLDLFFAIVNSKEEIVDGYWVHKIRIFKEDINDLLYLKDFLEKCDIFVFFNEQGNSGWLIFYLNLKEKQEFNNYISSREDFTKTLKK